VVLPRVPAVDLNLIPSSGGAPVIAAYDAGLVSPGQTESTQIT